MPWQQVAQAKKATLKYLYLTPDCRLDMTEVGGKDYREDKAGIHCSDVKCVGQQSIQLKEIAEYAHKVGAVIVVDAAQSVPHLT